MTYYNILYGLLFLGAFREVIHSLGTANIWAALLILTIIVNDLINVTDQFEQLGHSSAYTVYMKLVDLACFMALCVALICLDPDESFINMSVVKKIPMYDRPWLPWALLSAYWALAIVWNALSKEYNLRNPENWQDRAIQIWSMVMLIPFVAITLIVAAYGPIPFASKHLTIATLVVLILYMAHFKPRWWKTHKAPKLNGVACAYVPPQLPQHKCEAGSLEERLNRIELTIAKLGTAAVKPPTQQEGGS